ncbi:MAG: nitroreductase [Parvularculaceae bacterium]|jgi:nitroreductase|nr:nitroreductase [Parvularculaceae bacterium]
MTTVTDALKARISIRAFLDRPVPEGLVREILDAAKFAPSGGNLQPWKVHVVMDAARDRIVAAVKKSLAENPFANEFEIAVYPEGLWEPFRSRRFEVGEQMYALVGIPREDKAARLAWFQRNFDFFGAPVGLFFSIDRRFDRGQWAHLGMFMQTIALLAAERGLATCMQECWAARAKTVASLLDLPETEMLYCGMALGYADPDAAVNRLRTARAPLEEFVRFLR